MFKKMIIIIILLFSLLYLLYSNDVINEFYNIIKNKHLYVFGFIGCGVKKSQYNLDVKECKELLEKEKFELIDTYLISKTEIIINENFEFELPCVISGVLYQDIKIKKENKKYIILGYAFNPGNGLTDKEYTKIEISFNDNFCFLNIIGNNYLNEINDYYLYITNIESLREYIFKKRLEWFRTKYKNYLLKSINLKDISRLDLVKSLKNYKINFNYFVVNESLVIKINDKSKIISIVQNNIDYSNNEIKNEVFFTPTGYYINDKVK